MLSAPFVRISSLITFNFSYFTLIQQHVLFFHTFPMMFWTFLREKSNNPRPLWRQDELFSWRLIYKKQQSALIRNKGTISPDEEKKQNDLCLCKPKWTFPMVQELVSLFLFVFFFIFVLLCISSWTDSGRSNVLQESLFSCFQSDFNFYEKG